MCRNRHHSPRPSPGSTPLLRAPSPELLRALQGRRRRSRHPIQRRIHPGAHLLFRSPSPRPRPPAVRMELPAPALRRPARLLRGNVHPHPARPRRPPPEGTVSQLGQKIEQEIRERGPIPFSRYMELCLYDPELGYYSRNAEQFGKAGDFLYFKRCTRCLRPPSGPPVRRNVASPGLARANRTASNSAPAVACSLKMFSTGQKRSFRISSSALRYVLVERSPALRARIKKTLAHHLESGKAVCELEVLGGEQIGKSTTSVVPNGQKRGGFSP
jgi:hypothetical protein